MVFTPPANNVYVWFVGFKLSLSLSFTQMVKGKAGFIKVREREIQIMGEREKERGKVERWHREER